MRNLMPVGDKFYRWLVIGTASPSKNRHTRVQCLCDCGTIGLVETSQLKNGHSKSCGCYGAELTKTRNKKRPFEGIYNVLVNRSKTRDIIVELTYEDFLTFTIINECHYCGEKVIWNPHQYYKHSRQQRYNLDRKNSDLGYSKENCVVCCSDCNFTKGNRFSYDEMLRLGRTISEIRKDRMGKL